MDYQKAFTVIFEDKEWVSKILIGGLLFIASIFIVPIFFVLGYMIEYTQLVMNGDMSLPGWDNWGEKFKKGFFLFLTMMVYTLPAILILMSTFAVIALIAVIGSSGESGEAIAPLLAILMMGGYALYFVYLLLLYFLLPAIIVRFAQTESIGECLRVKEIFNIARAHVADILMLIVFLIVSGIITNIGIIACFVGVAFTGFYGMLVVHNLYGQFGKKLNEEA